jgi:hypothetical protein
LQHIVYAGEGHEVGAGIDDGDVQFHPQAERLLVGGLRL